MKRVWIAGMLMVASFSVLLPNKIVERMPHRFFKMPEGIKEDDYLPKTVVFKIREDKRCFFIPNFLAPGELVAFFNMIGAYDFQMMFPMAKPPRTHLTKTGKKVPDLTSIYYFKYMGNYPLEWVINKLISTNLFEYVEPYYLPEKLLIPNDPYYSQQWHLPKIGGPTAWDVSTGSPSVLVAIVDTGVEYTHPDLSPNIQVNTNEIPGNNIDDDNNGLVDDYYGWDFGDNDNNPAPGNPHGTHVAGCASAKGNNNTGVASPGFNCKLLAVKIENAQGQLTGGYQGIVYAAERGAHFINCSWGSSFYSSTGQDVVDYATSLGSVVVAAAGNDGTQTMFYPAAYDGVVAVASTGQNDTKSSFSNYGYWIDICAPGENIYSTIPGGGYGGPGWSGTSMASPIAAGSFALIKSYFTSYTPEQAVARAKATAYDIYPLHSLSYKYKLGAGRVDIGAALTQPQKAYVEMIDKRIYSNTSSYLPGDTLRIVGIFYNYLAPSGTITATLKTFSPYVQIINSTATLSSLATFQKDSNNTAPFKVVIKPTAPVNQEVWFTVEITDGTFMAYSSFNIFVNVDYIDITINDLWTSITSKGLIGYNQFGQTQGLGIKFNGQDLLYEMGVMIGSNNKVVDFVRNGTTNDADFQVVNRVTVFQPPQKADFETEGTFNDNPAPASDYLGVTVRHHTYAWDDPGHRKYVIVEYTVKNTSSSTLNPLYIGIFSDWDIPNADYASNRCKTSVIKKTTYAYNLNTPLYGGVGVVSQTPFISYCINNDGSGGSVNIYDDYTSSEKYLTLSTNRDTAGFAPSGTDVSAVTSSGPFALNPGDSITVAFVILADTTEQGLLASYDSAFVKYNGVNPPTAITDNPVPSSFHIYPNPASEKLILSGISNAHDIHIKIINAHGKIILSDMFTTTSSIKQHIIDVSELPAGFYTVEVNDGKTVHKIPVTIVK